MAEQAAGRLLPPVFFDAIRVKIRDEGFVRNKAVYIALGILPDGAREVLGLWIEQTEGAKFWLRVMNELKTRGLADVLIAVTDGLKGFPEAIEAAFPHAVVQTCPRHGLSDQWRSHGSMHLIRHSLEFMSWKDRKAVMPELRAIYRAQDADAGLEALKAFEAGPWGQRYPAIARSWRANWDRVIPFFAFPEAVRRIVYTTDEMDKRFVGSCAILSWRGRPRGEERRIGCKRRQAAYSSPAGLRRPRTPLVGPRVLHLSTKRS